MMGAWQCNCMVWEAGSALYECLGSVTLYGAQRELRARRCWSALRPVVSQSPDLYGRLTVIVWDSPSSDSSDGDCCGRSRYWSPEDGEEEGRKRSNRPKRGSGGARRRLGVRCYVAMPSIQALQSSPSRTEAHQSHFI